MWDRDDGPYGPQLLAAAHAEPRLRRLFPWTGMGEVHWVAGPLRIESVGPAATPEQAVAMVLDRLPPDCGPAFFGTRDEL